ncbi:hypothetical protein [Kriegella aquimaris]|uniref:Uncharacterized protein n=1 Tax=Kriegella aquimaris TaxID=192904 RepID=A0A1G9J606_9FLAO|nr:hypothetical protein [Kriegella aquimaris]SDL32781.1 hypothetical protein SAMN04488514_101414 [Kriegella aquimaris]
MKIIIKTVLFLGIAFALNPICGQENSSRYWNENLPLTSFRIPPPPHGAPIIYKDLDGDGDPDLLQTLTINNFPVQWIDDDDDMKEGDLSGDLDSDCLMIDRNMDGKYGGPYDLIVDWNDENGDNIADMQVVADQLSLDNNDFYPGHYMIMFDLDNDQIFNYINWNTFELEAWDHSGSSRFLEDYHGKSLFLKNHLSTFAFEDLRLNWEVPFLFFDPDNDGQTEMAIRVVDNNITKKEPKGPSLPNDPSMVSKADRNVKVDGVADLVAMTYDLDNDNSAGNEFDFDMSILFKGKGFDYMDQRHKFKSMIGLKGTDSLFYDARFRQLDELIFPNHDSINDLIYNRGEWNECWFVFDEDDDCHRWERVEFYDPLDLYKAGAQNGGLDNNPQADISGDRGEWDLDNSGKGNLYIGSFDNKIHLYGADWGAWRIDQNAKQYQGWQGWRQSEKVEGIKFPTVRYEDRNNNGFFDFIQYDLNGDSIFEHELDYIALGIDDTQVVVETKNMEFGDYEALFKKVTELTWKRAKNAVRIAKSHGVDTSWYANFKQVNSLREQYHFGYWLNFYIYMDLRDMALRSNDFNLLAKIDKAYITGNWYSLE